MGTAVLAVRNTSVFRPGVQVVSVLSDLTVLSFFERFHVTYESAWGQVSVSGQKQMTTPELGIGMRIPSTPYFNALLLEMPKPLLWSAFNAFIILLNH